MESATVSEQKDKPQFDEHTLAKLLEAAFVLQEHSHEIRALEAELGLSRNGQERDHGAAAAAGPSQLNSMQKFPGAAEPATAPGNGTATAIQGAGYSTTLARIADVQHQIEARQLKLDQALATVAEQLIQIGGAAGAAIGISNGKHICYRAASGITPVSAGLIVPLDKAFCFPCLRTGDVRRCPDVLSELVDAKECLRLGIGSFIAVPVFQHGDTAGGLELYYSDPGAFRDEDVQTCQLMAGIVTQALERNEPQVASATSAPAELETLAASTRCYKCGNELVGEEQFCGECGAARSHERPDSTMQSKVASLWQMKQASEGTKGTGANSALLESQDRTIDSSILESEAPINVRALQQAPGSGLEEADDWQRPEPGNALATEDSADQDAVKPEAAAPPDWSSALSARDFLEQVSQGNRRGWLGKFWDQHRGDIYLGIAIVLVVCVIRWGLSSSRAVTSPSAPTTAPAIHKPAAPELSLSERMLISLGLAEAPPPPEDKGNPATAVWVDVNTGLYYCPGADMYGKTPKGKFTSQRDAQLDEFAPAYRKPCN